MDLALKPRQVLELETSVTAESINQELRQTPFLPFRLVVSDGKTYDIRHPDFLWVRFTEAYVGTKTMSDPNLFERYDSLDIFHIIRVEPLPSSPSASPAPTNGTH